MTDRGECPNAANHTPMPEGYIARAERMEELYDAGYRQERCDGCNLFKVWLKPKK